MLPGRSQPKIPQAVANAMASSRQRAVSFDDMSSEPATVADAISSIAVVSALVFGFAASTFVAVMIDSPGNEWTEQKRIGGFCILMAIVSMMSGYATVYLSLQFYFLKRLNSMEAELVEIYLTDTARERHFASGLTWTSLAFYFAALSLLVSEVLPWRYSVPCTCFFALGGVLVLATWWRMMHRSSVASLRRMKHQMQKQVRDAQLKVLERSKVADGAEGPLLPDGLVVGQGHEMISNAWENEFRDNKYGETFEWVTPWSKIRSTVSPHLVPSGHQPADVHILQVGCGNSELASALHGEGFTKVWSIDCSATVIKQMKAAHAAYPGLKYEQMDVFAMTYPAGFFATSSLTKRRSRRSRIDGI